MSPDPMTSQVFAEQIPLQRSHGEGRIGVVSADGQTRLRTLFQEGCAKIRLPKIEGSTGGQAVLINTSGGLTGGDRLNWNVEIGPQAALTVTTQACERIYAASSGVTHLGTRIDVASGARLNWLPQETILFDRSQLKRRLDLRLHTDAEALIFEPVLFGRKAMAETLHQGLFQDSWRISLGDALCHAEETRLSGDLKRQLSGVAGAAGHSAMATIVLVSQSAEAHSDSVRNVIAGADHCIGGASAWNGKLLVRLLARDGYSMRNALRPIIHQLTNGRGVPRIWDN